MRKENSSKEQSNKKNTKGGFTLAELLIVVAIVGILVAISIPIFSAQIHKARVATDWANLRSYFSEIQADFISTGEYNPKVPTDDIGFTQHDQIDFLDGQQVKMKAGMFMLKREHAGNGYQIYYYCDKYLHGDYSHDKTCTLSLGVKGS